MQSISVTQPSTAELKALGVQYWPTWQKEVSVFPWEFVTTESAYILEGECIITPDNGGAATTFKAGDLVVFPNGYKGTWEVIKPLKKHYKNNDGNFLACLMTNLAISFNRFKSLFTS